MGWTKEQSKVIETRDKNILVSAAAGSGKTSVLVERIIQRVCDKDDPVDIDRILVVTFTNAAAGEMKERIYKALKEASDKAPEDERLKRQIALVFNSRISTIDAFCIYLIRNFFHESGIEPGLRIADSAEAEEIKALIMKDMLEEYYRNGDEAFISFCDDYAGRDRDLAVEDMILTLFTESESYPYPEEFFDEQKEVYNIASQEDLLDKKWLRELLAYTKNCLEGIRQKIMDDYDKLTDKETHPYATTLKSDMALVDELLSCKTYEEFYKGFCGVKYDRAPSSRGISEEEKAEWNAIKARRDSVKDEINNLKKKIYVKDFTGVYREVEALKSRMDMLIELTRDFSKRYKKEKEKRGLMEFSDAEHYALDILVDPKTKERTESAKILSREFAEVMVDEYQDSNLLQESILTAVTSDWCGGHNYFMVGDVKQSIYRFRQARPDIFTNKYLRYRKEESEFDVAIDLDCNFRSKKSVLDSANAVFEKIMKSDMGDVDYDERAALKFMGDPSKDEYHRTRLIVSDSKGSSELLFNNKDEYEASIIAGEIKKLMSETDISFSDIVILHRSGNNAGGTIKEVLKQFDIPAVIVKNTGYFSSVEVEVFLSLFTILANPMSDIPLAAVMESVLFGFTDEQLAEIRLYDKSGVFCETVFEIAGAEGCPEKVSEELYEKIVAFVAKINEWRELSSTVPVYKLMWQIISETGYDTYVAALPEGDLRKDNIDKLLSLAVSYGEGCSIREFVRNIERISKYDKEIPAASVGGIDAVSIMTIHKSKGLEFPVVFLAGCGREIRPESRKLVTGKELGIATSLYNAENRTKSNTLIKNFIVKKNHLDDLGEEQRLLYVAMTRAKDRLIITGIKRDAAKLWEKSADMMGQFTFVERASAKSYLHWLLPVALHRTDAFETEFYDWQDVVKVTASQSARSEVKTDELLARVDEVPDAELSALSEQLEYEYPREINTETKIKYSVSEIKRKAMEESLDAEELVSVFSDQNEEKYVPLFISGKTHHISGAVRGTAVHRYMECFDFGVEDRAGAYSNEKERMEEGGLLREDEAELLSQKEIETFLSSELCERMHRAALSGVLKKEAAFIMSGDEDILIQGIIDVFFEEEDGIVLVDYKTDRIDNDASLVARYKKQMELYRDAIERTHSKKVKDMILYSFCLGREIYV